MNLDTLMQVSLMIYDELSTDKAKESKAIIKKIDRAKSDQDWKDGIVAAVARLRELGKTAMADNIQSQTKGFAF